MYDACSGTVQASEQEKIMSHSAVMHGSTTLGRTESAVARSPERAADPGPWLFLAAPVTFAITVAVICAMSRLSF